MLVYATVVLLILSIRIFYNYIRLWPISGPVYACVSDLWRGYAHQSPDYSRRLRKLHQKHGQVVRIGPTVVSISEPEAIVRFYGSREQEKSIRDFPLISERDQAVSSICISNGLRNGSINDVSCQHTNFLRYEGIIDQSASDLISALLRYRILEITGPLQVFASEFVHRVLTKMPWNSSKGVAGTGPSPSMVEYLMLWSPIMRLKRERQELFSCMLSRQYSWAPPGFNPEGQNEEVNEISKDYSSVVTAGLKAISTAFVSTFPLLLQHPETMGRLVEEVDTAFYNENLSESSQWEEVSRLRYLDAVFKESIRCQPTTSSIEVSVSRSDTTIAGHYLPAGTVIEWQSDSFKIDEDVYGEDVENFRPERWLVADQQERKHMEQGLLAFYISRQTCMASPVVFLELKKVIVMILLQFNMELLASDGNFPEERSQDAEFLPRMVVNLVQRVH
ncbi:hypothetical protein SI65_00022 [Aspergillus cristatus]|uniref:Cytochrome P450 n=1 Tax=Aspergillus cristatus TaxID=573508 RepID=A0A1E3BN87_ASPCR|nr:hypothetical protein SI65_00022 [Aspergillus cristatus]